MAVILNKGLYSKYNPQRLPYHCYNDVIMIDLQIRSLQKSGNLYCISKNFSVTVSLKLFIELPTCPNKSLFKISKLDKIC